MLIDPEDNVAEADLESSERFSLLRFLRHPLQFIAAWRELRYSRKAARLALARYQGLRVERPELTGRALYEVFVCDRNAIGASAARVILQRAEASFATWPTDRDLKFMDVLKYLVISEYLVSHPKRGGTSINMARIIEQMIPRKF
jgi:hypothetical protein